MYREWLKRGLAKPGKSAIGLAMQLTKLRGKPIGRSTVYAMLEKRKILPDELAVIAAYIEEPPPGFLKISSSDILSLPIERRIGAGIWFESDVEKTTDLGTTYTRRVGGLPDSDHVAYLMQGDSMGAAIPDGSTIIATRYNGHWFDNAQVIVERERNGIKEISVRIAETGKLKTVFRVASTNTIYKPIVLAGKKSKEPGESVKILALVQIVYVEPNKSIVAQS